MAIDMPDLNATYSDSARKRVLGLDTIRFFLAMWVVFGHIGVFPIEVNESNVLGKIFAGIYNNLFSAPAAVIVFFVISGFCIHYPFRGNKKPLLIPYFARRHLRIWVPIVAAILIAIPLGVKLTLLQDSILWSLLAEEIYYLIYPGLLFLRRRFGWKKILFASYIVAILVVLRDPSAGNYPSYGPYFNWALGLPCWLLGCCLAEKTDRFFTSTASLKINISNWRFAAWFLSFVCSALRFHSPIKYPWTLTLFAVFAFFWLEKEILYYRVNAPIPLLEKAGKGSYSIYLVHLLGPALYVYWSLPIFSPVMHWLVQIIFTLLLCCVFYLLVEKPSHSLARAVAEKLSPNSPKIAAIRVHKEQP
ncbi:MULTISPECIES: acyltransferase family protein [Cyanophyceae]|uniref:Acyltransferase n=1 Tax=Leptolyngbya subtilissima DQ-A4 TaxID=2933933 RepID=A0ABV0K488_9CYAN|nr:acyltransferase [Nodosilinea sp. FACHB-141]MBD2113573.1 acyltransferase [Nodosilinea sp. FACHB-141]